MKCPGCGVELQFEDPKKPGFIPKDVFERRLASGDEILCQRCFRLKHYNRYEPVKLDTDFMKELKGVLGSFDLVIWVLDITDFEGSYTEKIGSLLKGKEIIYAVTKVDLLPRAVSLKEVKEWLKERIKPENPEDIRLVSSVKKFGIRSLKKRILSKGSSKALIVGVTNVGKSSLLNELAEHETTVSPYPGTTLSLIRRKMKGKRFHLYDTPGIVIGDRVIDLLDPDCQRRLAPKRQLTRRTYKPEKGRVILVGGCTKITVDYETDLRPIFQIFTYNGVKLHETNPDKAEELLKNRIGDFLVPPCDKNTLENVEWKREKYELDQYHELVVKGYFWINVKRGPVKFIVEVPKSVGVVLRDRLIVPKR